MNIDARLSQQVEDHPYPLVFATISGAHLYGFPSPDSDFDLRGVHLLPLEEVVGLKPGHDTIEKSGIHDGLEIDLVTHDAKKFFELMLKKNGYVLEQLLSPLVVHTTPEHMELRGIAAKCVTRHHAHHYLGFAETQWKLFQKTDPPHVKPLLYVYRVLLTGIHLMRTSEVEANLVRLNETARLPYIAELMDRKTSGPEKGRLEQADLEFHQREYERLRAELQRAFDESKLPQTPSGAAALHDLLVRLRLKEISPGAWGRQLMRHFAEVIVNVYRRPQMYVGSRAEPNAIECVLWMTHQAWAKAADKTNLLFEAIQNVSEAEQCGAMSFHRRFRERYPSASDNEAMDYVLACWQRVSASLGIGSPDTNG